MPRRQFTKEDMEAPERTEYMPFGVNNVKLVGSIADETPDGKEYIEIGVVNPAGIEDSARLWFNGGAAKYSVDTIRQIAVHKMKTEADKEKARTAVDACKDIDELSDLISSKLDSAEAWLTKYYDPTRTYTNANGETKRSINTNLVGYEPKLKPELMPQEEDHSAGSNDAAFFADMGDTKVVDGTIEDDGTVTIPSANGWGN